MDTNALDTEFVSCLAIELLLRCSFTCVAISEVCRYSKPRLDHIEVRWQSSLLWLVFRRADERGIGWIYYRINPPLIVVMVIVRFVPLVWYAYVDCLEVIAAESELG